MAQVELTSARCDVLMLDSEPDIARYTAVRPALRRRKPLLF
jgi:hypothetical protein